MSAREMRLRRHFSPVHHSAYSWDHQFLSAIPLVPISLGLTSGSGVRHAVVLWSGLLIPRRNLRSSEDSANCVERTTHSPCGFRHRATGGIARNNGQTLRVCNRCGTARRADFVRGYCQKRVANSLFVQRRWVWPPSRSTMRPVQGRYDKVRVRADHLRQTKAPIVKVGALVWLKSLTLVFLADLVQ